MIIRCAVVDDDENDLKRMEKVIAELSGSANTEFECDYYLSSSDPAILNSYDLYILDIDMPGKTGFVLAKDIQELYPETVIIFCTNHDDLVFDSFKLQPFYFVRKTFLSDDLLIALRKYIELTSAQIKNYCINDNGNMIRIPAKSITYVEVIHNTLYIHTDSKEYAERKSMTTFLRSFPDRVFIQINQSTLLNLKYVSELSNTHAKLFSGEEFPVSRYYASAAKSAFMKSLR